MKTIVKSAIAVAIVCLLAGLAHYESAVAATHFPNVKTTGSQTDVQNDVAAKLTEQFMEKLPEISTH